MMAETMKVISEVHEVMQKHDVQPSNGESDEDEAAAAANADYHAMDPMANNWLSMQQHPGEPRMEPAVEPPRVEEADLIQVEQPDLMGEMMAPNAGFEPTSYMNPEPAPADEEEEEEEEEEDRDEAPPVPPYHGNMDFATSEMDYGLPVYSQSHAPDYDSHEEPPPTHEETTPSQLPPSHDLLNHFEPDVPPQQPEEAAAYDYGGNEELLPSSFNPPEMTTTTRMSQEGMGGYPEDEEEEREMLGGEEQDEAPVEAAPDFYEERVRLSSSMGHNGDGHHEGLPTPPPDSPSLLLPEGQQQLAEADDDHHHYDSHPHPESSHWMASPSKMGGAELGNDASYPPTMMTMPPDAHEYPTQQMAPESDEFL